MIGLLKPHSCYISCLLILNLPALYMTTKSLTTYNLVIIMKLDKFVLYMILRYSFRSLHVKLEGA